VENRPGAGGAIAATAVTREKPDGYTLFRRVGPNAISQAASKLAYDPHNAFADYPRRKSSRVVLVRPTLPYKTLAEFIAAAKERPGKFNYACRARQLDTFIWPTSTAKR
jgi:tripartite-type tricarboxylate transporter receptor subunit TctC